jgi:hypothetical protein
MKSSDDELLQAISSSLDAFKESNPAKRGYKRSAIHWCRIEARLFEGQRAKDGLVPQWFARLASTCT